jgi:hypothetical protein
MKVSEVIARLAGMNQEAEVIFPDFIPVVRVVNCDGYVVVTDQYEVDEDHDDEDSCMGCGCCGCNGGCCV